MTPEQIQQFKYGGKLMIELAETAEQRDYLVKNATSVQKAHNQRITDLEDRLRDAKRVIARQEEQLHEKDLSQHEAKIDGQGIEYWHSVATSALQTNDHLITRQRELLASLKEKERINADLEQQLRAADIASQNQPSLNRNCNNVLRFMGEPYPRTCRHCGVGKCNDTEGLKLKQRMETETAVG